MILLTGADGFIGQHVVQCLLEAAAAPAVRAFLIFPNEAFAERFPDVATVCGDLLDEAALSEALAGVETVVHLASKNVDHDGSGFEQVNVSGTRLLGRLAAAAGVRRLIYVSSVGIYGHGVHRDADEATPVAPDTPFSRSKAEAERILLEHHRAGDFQTRVLRHRFVYGEGDRAVLPRLIKAARSYPFWISGGRARMSLVWAGDLAEVVRRLALGAGEGGAAGEPVYHITDGAPISYRRVITTICETFGYRPPRISLPFGLLYAPVRLRELLLRIDPEVTASSVSSIRLKLVAQDNTFANRKLARLLPEQRYVAFDEGFRRSLEFYSQFR